MLNMGFSDSINEIFESLPDDHATLMFSATMSREVERVATKYPLDFRLRQGDRTKILFRRLALDRIA